MWAAYFQVDGDMRHTVAVRKFRGAVEQALEEFVARMTNPEVGVWFTWVEECDATDTSLRSADDTL
jgi:hypothetical protein